MSQPIWLSWSSGKDSAWALRKLRQDPNFEVTALFTTVNRKFDRVAMHAVRTQLLQRQAASVGLPLRVVEIPHPCSNAQYEQIMGALATEALASNISCFAFGDLFLEDIRTYREARLADVGIKATFPLWGLPTNDLAQEMIDKGLEAVVTCVDPQQMDECMAGRRFDAGFLQELGATVDWCGENGEFHTFVVAGPMLRQRIDVDVGKIERRDGFVFCDLLPAA